MEERGFKSVNKFDLKEGSRGPTIAVQGIVYSFGLRQETTTEILSAISLRQVNLT